MGNFVNVDTSKNLYTYNYVNCFEKPLGLILNNYGDVLQSFFYIFLKLFQSYGIKDFEGQDIFYTVSFNNALRFILEEKLDFKIEIVEEVPDRIHRVIKKRTDEGYPALVPGNLRELPYSEYYRTGDWKHLFLISGYDEEKEIYTVIDSDHKKNDHLLEYKKAFMSFGLLERLYASAKEKFNIANIWGIDKKDGSGYPKEKELLNDVFDLFLNHRTNQPYKELEYINRINSEIDEKAEEKEEALEDPTAQIDFIFLRAVKYKETFYNELTKMLKRQSIENEPVERLSLLKTNILKKWNDIANTALVQHYLKEKADLNREIAEVTGLEEEMRQFIGSLQNKFA